MADSAFDASTLRFYTAEAPVYAASGPDGRSRHLDDFLARLSPGASILELGCGGGRDSEHMIRRGFIVDPTDGVVEMARKAQERLDKPVRVLRFDQLDATEDYDAVWAHASLLHVPRPALPVVLASIWRALKPTGWHFANYKGGDQEGRDKFDRYFNYVTADELRVAYTAAGPWRSIGVSEYEGGGYDGGLGPWNAFIAQKQ